MIHGPIAPSRPRGSHVGDAPVRFFEPLVPRSNERVGPGICSTARPGTEALEKYTSGDPGKPHVTVSKLALKILRGISRINGRKQGTLLAAYLTPLQDRQNRDNGTVTSANSSKPDLTRQRPPDLMGADHVLYCLR